MKSLCSLLLLILLNQFSVSAQNSDTSIYLSIANPAVYTGNIASGGGLVPQFTDPAINALVSGYTFTKFEQAFPNSNYEYLREVYDVKCNNTKLAADLKAAFPDVFPYYELHNAAIAIGNNPSNVRQLTAAYAPGVVLSPNPAKDKLYISDEFAGHVTGITASNLIGKVALVKMSGPGNEINIGNFASGIYMFTITLDNQQPLMERIVVQNGN